MRRRSPPPIRLTLITLAILTLAATPARSQTVLGRVLDDTRETPVRGALVRLLDRDGEERAQALSDSVGRFVIAPPDPDDYYLEVTRIGYQRTTTPLLALRGEGTAPLELMMQPAPIGLEGFAVEVDAVSRAQDELRLSGVEPSALGNRFIGQDRIDAIAIKQDVGRILEWNSIGGMRVIRPENLTSGSDPMGLCVSLSRARTAGGMGRCAMIVWNGIQIDQIAALDIDPETIAAMAVLTPIEAVILYGKRGEAGAVVMWSRQGGGR